MKIEGNFVQTTPQLFITGQRRISGTGFSRGETEGNKSKQYCIRGRSSASTLRCLEALQRADERLQEASQPLDGGGRKNCAYAYGHIYVYKPLEICRICSSFLHPSPPRAPLSKSLHHGCPPNPAYSRTPRKPRSPTDSFRDRIRAIQLHQVQRNRNYQLWNSRGPYKHPLDEK